MRLYVSLTGWQTLEMIYAQLAGNADKLFDALGPARPQFLQSLRRLRDAIAAVEGSLESGKPPTLR